MLLTKDQQSMLDGEQGEAQAEERVERGKSTAVHDVRTTAV